MHARKTLLLIIGLTTGLLLNGQTGTGNISISMPYPVHSQYLQNGLVINPAYAGSRESLTFFGSVRKQWAGVSGSPVYETFSMHSLLKNNRVGLGLTAQFLTYGPSKATSVYAVYAYHLTVGRARLSMGLRGGFDMSNTNYAGLKLVESGDLAFSGDFKPYFMPNVGAGLYLYNRRFFVGASVPQFFSYIKTSDGKISFNTFQKFTVQATAGCLITFADAFKFKPSVFVEYSLDKTRKPRLDINGNFIIKDLFWIGASYRTNEKVLVAILQVQLNSQLMLGYSYDYAMGVLSNYSSGSHEFVVRYEFGYKVTAANPRYF